MTPPILTLTDRFSVLAPRYEVVLSDIWGVLHNGVAAFPEAGPALAKFRADGGAVILISNAPRPGYVIERHLANLGVVRECYDAIVTSGDVCQHYIASRPGARVFHLGPERDLANFRDVDVTLGPIETADYVVCTGLFNDEVEGPDDYRAMLATMRDRNLFMVCANPDLVVERGDRLLYCAGALADLYAEMGGQVLYTGKPHRPIYDEALDKIAVQRGVRAPLERILAIGDSVRTDLSGATALGVDSLFVTGGIHAEEIGGRDAPDLEALNLIFAEARVKPIAVTQRLAW